MAKWSAGEWTIRIVAAIGIMLLVAGDQTNGYGLMAIAVVLKVFNWGPNKPRQDHLE